MPAQYEAIRDSFKAKGMPTKEAKTRAAKIFISRGKAGNSRTSRAKMLHSDRKASR